ncbi:UbiA family prenyltransferase [Jiangella alba]|uniref:4-hydroxybenzoate polyprenyltransferase n=1 Tax=Jiangella alba TaxID=561176 RepID=A0A1H5MNS5_9ACTN|nr:UbiA family prenyltransferase [Jiangella alba]SEE90261.1 4-hydroxybenzoate polyprenyltransferase [Jiangella alba]
MAVATAATGLVRACHPEPTAAVTALSGLLALRLGHDPGTLTLVMAAVFTGQLTVGWSNDLVDAGRDVAVGRTDKPLATGRVSARTVAVALAVAAAACVVLSLALGPAAGLVHLGLVGCGVGYNLLLKRTALSWLPYAVAFGLLPAVVSLALDPPQWPPWWMIVAGALLGVGAHLVNVLPDLADDAATGVRGLPHRIGPARTRVVAVVVLVAASLLVVLGPGRPPAWAWAGLALVVVLAAVALRGRGSAPFRAAMAIALVDVVLLVLRS